MANYTQREWLAKVEELGWRCAYCGSPVNEKAAQSEHKLTPDHVIPRSRGGEDKLWNLVPACLRCNLLKKNLTAHEFVKDRPVLCKYAVSYSQVLFMSNQNAGQGAEEISTSVNICIGVQSMLARLSAHHRFPEPLAQWAYLSRRQLLRAQTAQFLRRTG